MPDIALTVNGKKCSLSVDDHALLVDSLRQGLSLTGTHVGCDTSQCGACIVHVNGKAIKSCTTLSIQHDGANVLTIEGLEQNGSLHPMQEAFRDNHALQCGFCTPGMIMSAIDIVNRYRHNNKSLGEIEIRHELEGNLCRCTGYHNIVKAILDGARRMNEPN